MAFYKNKASQKIGVFAYDEVVGAAKTGDAANITGQISKDYGSAAATNDTNPTEHDATNFPGLYVFDITQTESNCDVISLKAKSSTANVVFEILTFHTEPETRAASIAAGSIAADAIDAASLKADAVTTIQSGLALAANLQSLSEILAGSVVASGTVGIAGNDTTHVHLHDLTFADGELNDLLVVIYDASGNQKHARWIDDYVASSQLATVATLPFTPVGTDLYWVLSSRRDALALNSSYDPAKSAASQSSVDAVPTAAENRAEMDSNSTKLASIETDTQDIQTRLPAALTGDGMMKSDMLYVNGTGQSNGDLNLKIDAVGANALLARKLIEADRYIDTSGSPWQVVWIEKGTGTPTLADGNELLRQDLFDTDGVALVSEDTIPGQTIEA